MRDQVPPLRHRHVWDLVPLLRILGPLPRNLVPTWTLDSCRSREAVVYLRNMIKEDLDFEISFYEDILKGKPNIVQALIPLGDAYTKKGLHEKGLTVDRRLARLRPDDETVHYNLACDYSLLQRSDQCITSLRKAIRLGYSDFEHMEHDPDLAFIRQDPRYKALLRKHIVS